MIRWIHFSINKILSDSIGLPNGSEHKLPWYPPVCDDSSAFGEKHVQQSERHVLNNEIKSNQFLRNHFIKYVNNGKADEAEIGQRIITAMEKVCGCTCDFFVYFLAFEFFSKMCLVLKHDFIWCKLIRDILEKRPELGAVHVGQFVLANTRQHQEDPRLSGFGAEDGAEGPDGRDPSVD